MIQAKVKSHEGENHINHVGLVYQSKDAIILLIDLNTKYKEIGAYGGATDSDVDMSIWFGMDELQLTLPAGFGRTIQFGSTSRYTCYICLFRYNLLEKYTYESDYDDVTLWENQENETTDFTSR